MAADLPTGPDAAPYDPAPYFVQDTSTAVFPPDRRPAVITLQSVKDVRQLLLLWTLPPQVLNYGTKSMEYISTLLGSEAKGSLLASLKHRGWVNSLSAGPDLSTGQFELFQVDLDLTPKGMQPDVISQIIQYVYNYIRLIETQGIEEWRWHEMGTISAIHFRLKNKETAQSYVSSLAADMPKFAPRDLLMANFMYMTYDPAGIQNLLSLLTPQSMLVLVASQNGDGLTETEKWYGTKYRVDRPAQDQVDRWMSSRFDDPVPETNEVSANSVSCVHLGNVRCHLSNVYSLFGLVRCSCAETDSVSPGQEQVHSNLSCYQAQGGWTQAQ